MIARRSYRQCLLGETITSSLWTRTRIYCKYSWKREASEKTGKSTFPSQSNFEDQKLHNENFTIRLNMQPWNMKIFNCPVLYILWITFFVVTVFSNFLFYYFLTWFWIRYLDCDFSCFKSQVNYSDGALSAETNKMIRQGIIIFSLNHSWC